jgi:hypothetical protein
VEEERVSTLKFHSNDSAYLYEICDGDLGVPLKQAQANKNPKSIYYNFTPHDKNDPILLTLFLRKENM